MAKNKLLEEAMLQFKKLEDKMSFKRVYTLDEAMKWFSKHPGDHVICVNGQKTAVAQNDVECKIFYADCK